jgi:hypothetical protein
MGRRQCELEGCSKRAISGGTPYCIAHGGGKRCQEETAPRELYRALSTVARMAGANGAKRRTVTRQLEATRASLIWNEMQLTICSKDACRRF